MGEPKKKSSLVRIGMGVLVCLFLMAVAIPNFIKSHATYAENACVNNLRQIEAAKQKWAAENGKANSTVVTEGEIIPYLKGGSRTNFIECPAGGKYTIGKISELPTCSLGTTVIPAHVLQ